MNAHEIIKRPLLTEKNTQLKDQNNQYCFEVNPAATKDNIKLAVEKLFKVKVKTVRTMQCRGKMKRVGRFTGMTSNWKKAIVTLQKGMTIELFEGV